MPASRSRKREPEPPPPSRRIWPLALAGLLAVAVIAAIALPASLLRRFLPPDLEAEGFSGSIWHGSAAQISMHSRPIGALEWRLHPWSLFALTVALDLHWVKGGTVIDGRTTLDGHGFDAHDVHGGGPIEDLRDFGLAPGWHGNVTLDLREIEGTFDSLDKAIGTIDVAALASAGVAHGADLGDYRITLAPGAVSAGGVSATIDDTGGPLQAHADIRYVAASRMGLLTGTLRERAEASPDLRAELTNLTDLKPRNEAGQIPIEFEFSL